MLASDCLAAAAGLVHCVRAGGSGAVFGAMTTGKMLFLLDAAAMLIIWPILLKIGCWGNECTRFTPDGAAVILYPVANLISFYALGLYRRDAILQTRESLGRVPLAVSLGAVATAVLLVMLGLWIGSPANRVRLFSGAVIGFCMSGVTARLILAVLKTRGSFQRRLLIVGAGNCAWDLLCMLRKEGQHPQYRVTFMHEPAYGAIDPRLLEGLGDGNDVIEGEDVLSAAKSCNPDEIVVAPDERRGMPLDRLLSCKREGYPVLEYLTFIEHEIRRVDIKRMEVGWLLYSGGFYFGTIDNALKRALDVSVSLLLLVLFSPFLIGAAIAIKLDDGGPVLYSQDRITRNEKTFRIYKLRTMRTDAEKAGAVWAAEHDPRVTRVGHFLRRTRIDEMPQLINVLRGDMSLVGPRPERPGFSEKLAEQLPLYNERHMVKAGLTGWAQINYPYGASLDDARSKLSYDLYYVKNFSILFDLLILLQTLRVVLWPSGAR
jgi:sugar transferase (PEP-CTERM system associated)